MENPFTQYEQEVLTALYKSLNYCEENDLPTFEITQALLSIEKRVMNMEVVQLFFFPLNLLVNCLILDIAFVELSLLV